MKRLLVIFCMVLFYFTGFSQQNILLLKKGNRTIEKYWKGSLITVQLENETWQKGNIIRIQNDSLFIRPVFVLYTLLGTDTFHFSIIGIPLHTILALPKKGVLVDYRDGTYQISTSGGHQHWYWIKSGWLFRAGAAGYAGLNIINGVVSNDLSTRGSRLGITAGVFVLGMALKHIHKLRLVMGKKYHLEILDLSK